MKRPRKLLMIVAVAAPLLAYIGWAGYLRVACDRVHTNAWVGCTEEQIRRSYGPPVTDSPGYQPLARKFPPSLPPGPIRTLIFRPRGLFHPSGGTLWVWANDRNGVWGCFESCWFADGVEF